MTRLRARILPWLLPAALLAFWQLGAQSGLIVRTILPAPSNVALAFWHLAQAGELWRDIAVSAARAGAGFAIGGGLGLALGVLNGTAPVAANLTDTSLQMLRNIPHLALIPLVILWFGIGEGAKLFLVAAGVFFPIYLNTYHGVRTVDAGLREMAESYGLDRWRLFREIVLPGALPSILLGVRYGLGIMWLTLIVAETISATNGIGYLTMNAREFLQTDVVVLGILIYAALGKAADAAAQALERRFLAWHPGFRRATGR